MPKKSKAGGKGRGENGDEQQAIAIVCAACKKSEPPDGTPFSLCTACKRVYYCDKDCQRWHWRKGGHKQECAKLQESARESTDEAKTPARTEQQSADAPSTSVTPTKPDAIHAVCIGEDGYHTNIRLSLLEFKELERDGIVPPLPKRLGNDIFVSKPNHSEDIAILMMDPTTGETLPYWKGACETCVIAYSDGSPFSTDNLEHLVQMLREFRDRDVLQSIPPRDTAPFASQLLANEDKKDENLALTTELSVEDGENILCILASEETDAMNRAEVLLAHEMFLKIKDLRLNIPPIPQKLGINLMIVNPINSKDIRLLMMDPKTGNLHPGFNIVWEPGGSPGHSCDCVVASSDGKPYSNGDHLALITYLVCLKKKWVEEGIEPSSWDLSPRAFQGMLRSERFRGLRRTNKLETVLAPRVRLFGLQAQSELNGQHGFRGKWIKKDGRFQVFLDNDDDKIIRLIKPSNIHVFPSECTALPTVDPNLPIVRSKPLR